MLYVMIAGLIVTFIATVYAFFTQTQTRQDFIKKLAIMVAFLISVYVTAFYASEETITVEITEVYEASDTMRSSIKKCFVRTKNEVFERTISMLYWKDDKERPTTGLYTIKVVGWNTNSSIRNIIEFKKIK